MKRMLSKKQTGGSTKIRPVIKGASEMSKTGKDTTRTTPKPAPNPVAKPLAPRAAYKGSFAKKKTGGSTGAFDRYSKKK